MRYIFMPSNNYNTVFMSDSFCILLFTDKNSHESFLCLNYFWCLTLIPKHEKWKLFVKSKSVFNLQDRKCSTSLKEEKYFLFRVCCMPSHLPYLCEFCAKMPTFSRSADWCNNISKIFQKIKWHFTCGWVLLANHLTDRDWNQK